MFIVKTIDLFGKKAAFNFNGSKKSRSMIGGLTSLLFFGFIVWSIYHVGNDMIIREQPKTITSESFSENPSSMILSPETFTFAFGVQYPDTYIHYINDSIYTVEVNHRQLTREFDEKGVVHMKWKVKSLNVERCTLDHFGSLGSKFSTLELSQLYCLSKEQPNLGQIQIQGIFESPLYEYIEVTIKECDSTLPNAECISKDVRDKTLGGGWFAVYYPNLAIDPKNYSNPNTHYRDSYYTTIGNTYFKEVTMWLNHVEVSTDAGWLLDDVSSEKYISFDSARENTHFRSDLKKIMSLIVRVGKITTYYGRSYKKIQDIMADVDGLATLALIIGIFLIGPYSDLKFYENLINELFDIQTLKKLNSLRSLKASKDEKNESSKPPGSKNDLPVLAEQSEATHSNNPRGHLKRKETFAPVHRPSEDNVCDVSNFPLKGNMNAFDLSPLDQPISNKKEQKKLINFKPTTLTKKIYLSPKGFTDKKAEEITIDRNATVLSEPKSSERRKVPNFRSLQQIDKKVENDQPNRLNKLTLSVSATKFSQEKSFSNKNLFNKKPVVQKLPTKILESYEVSTPTGMQAILGSIMLEKEYQTRTNENGKIQESDAGKEHDLNDKSIDHSIQIDKEVEAEPNRQEVNNSKSDEDLDESVILERAKRLPAKLHKTYDKIQISFWDYIRSFIWKTEALKEKMSILEEGTRRINERLDIFKVLKKFREIDKLKLLLLENEQLVLFDTLPQPELSCSYKGHSRKATTFAHSQLKEAKFVAEQRKNDLITLSYGNLKKKREKTMIDLKLLEIYDDILLS